MPSTLPSFTLGFHGCSQEVAAEVIEGRRALGWSTNSYDWIGGGIYFWENDPKRAWEWARKNKRIENPDVVGAIIDYGNCLNLLDSSDMELVVVAHDTLAASGTKLPKNEPGYPGDQDEVRRELDCMVIESVHKLISSEGRDIDTVRAMFPEGEEAYAGAGFRKRNHIQLCVRTLASIRGYFRPIDPDTGSVFRWGE